MNSMTGFGRGEAEKDGRRITIEIKTVNHRYLDINLRTPRVLLPLEEYARSEIKKRLARGRVEVFINYKNTSDAVGEIRADLALAKKYAKAAAEIAGAVGIEQQLPLESLMRMDGVLTVEEAQEDEALLKELFSQALAAALDVLNAARAAEGQRMVVDLLERGEIILDILSGIEQREPVVIEEYQEKLRAKLEEFLSGTPIDENRFQAEILYFTDKSNITEEIVRIKSHVAQLKETMAKDEALGRNLDFLIQELNREFNTIGSKSSDVAITKGVLAAKAEVEKIREQVQNLE